MSNEYDRDANLTQSDEGTPVGDADVQADIDRASDDSGGEPSNEEFLQEGQRQMASDDGESTGAADVDADREAGSR